ncbi:hypothetical protein MOX01_35370 [Microbacterium oxydans]|nr:hypothetical protein MOX01_35370 [Microbacterium oxydans]
MVELDALMTALPALLGQVQREQTMTREQLTAELGTLGLHQPVYDDGLPEDDEVNEHLWVRAPLTGVGDTAAAERQLRTAISRKAGKTIGSDKHWDLGPFKVTARIRRDGELELWFVGTYSLRVLRDAAKDYLDGADPMTWLLAHELIDEGAEENERGFFPKPKWVSQNPTARLLPDGGVSASLTFPAARRPPGATAKNDDDAYAATLAYLEEALGERDDPSPNRTPVWTRGARKFTFYRMRSSTRSARFGQVGIEEPEESEGGA